MAQQNSRTFQVFQDPYEPCVQRRRSKEFQHGPMLVCINYPTPSTNNQSLSNDHLNVTGEVEQLPYVMNFCKYFFGITYKTVNSSSTKLYTRLHPNNHPPKVCNHYPQKQNFRKLQNFEGPSTTLQLSCVNGLQPAPFNLTCLETIILTR